MIPLAAGSLIQSSPLGKVCRYYFQISQNHWYSLEREKGGTMAQENQAKALEGDEISIFTVHSVIGVTAYESHVSYLTADSQLRRLTGIHRLEVGRRG